MTKIPKQTFLGCPTNVCLDSFVFAEFFSKPGRPLCGTLLSIAAAVVLSFAATGANAWEHNSTVTGPRGNSRSVERAGGCSGGTCSYAREVTGPAGNSRTGGRSASGASGEDGASWQRGATATGSNGNSVTYGGSGSCSDGICSYESGHSGPNGTVSRSGTISRD